MTAYMELLDLTLQWLLVHGEVVLDRRGPVGELHAWWGQVDEELAAAQVSYTGWPLGEFLTTMRAIAAQYRAHTAEPSGVVGRGPTYVIAEDARAAGGRVITCFLCQRTSANPHDVERRYCGHCHLFHDDLRFIRPPEPGATEGAA
jgi:hypothetical protein